MNKILSIFYSIFAILAVMSYGLENASQLMATDYALLFLLALVQPIAAFCVATHWFSKPIHEVTHSLGKTVGWLWYLLATFPPFLVLAFAWSKGNSTAQLAHVLMPLYLGFLWLVFITFWSAIVVFFNPKTST